MLTPPGGSAGLTDILLVAVDARLPEAVDAVSELVFDWVASVAELRVCDAVVSDAVTCDVVSRVAGLPVEAVVGA